MEKQRVYLAIDLKSFFASVECVERGLDPMTTNLVVADPSRTDKTICLAITPAMKALGIKNRCRVFEIPAGVSYIMAPPRMQRYLDYSAEIYGVYLKYIAKEDIQVYSVDEVFMDVTNYLSLYQMTPRELGVRIMEDILKTTGIRSTCGIGTNLYLAKIALDIMAKHAADFIGELNEETYKRDLWHHQPLTDFWRVGPGTARRLATIGIYDMAGISQADEDILYRLFGVDAELLIDHANGIEPTTIADIKAYRPSTNSLSSGQVLMRNYKFNEGELIVKEMTDLMCLDLVAKKLVTDSVTLTVGYSNRLELKPAHGSTKLDILTSADTLLVPAVVNLYRRIVDPTRDIRRITIDLNNVRPEEFTQYTFLHDMEALARDKKIQEAVIDIKDRFGKNAIVKGMNLLESGTTMERNGQIGGHKSDGSTLQDVLMNGPLPADGSFPGTCTPKDAPPKDAPPQTKGGSHE